MDIGTAFQIGGPFGAGLFVGLTVELVPVNFMLQKIIHDGVIGALFGSAMVRTVEFGAA